MDLPKVNIAFAGSAIIAICSTLGGGVWYASSQASIIEGLTSQVEKLTIENSATDRTNLIRDVEQNADNILELTEILSEFYEDMEDADDDIYSEIDELHQETASMASHMMAIVKLQSRIAILEKTVEFTRRDGM
jgi:ATPase subunit of ABC transporter with duplicated ATPase domains